MTQLVLDLFGDQARVDEFVIRHQVGQIRLPWDTAAGEKAGDLIPAWVCCHCGGVELCQYFLMLDHGCENRADGCRASCRYRRDDRPHPYRMDAHWVPPAERTEA